MAVLVGLAAILLVAWLVTRGSRTGSPSAPLSEEGRVDLLVEALYRDGVKWGYQSAWSRQIVTEGQRVRLFVKRRNQMMLASLAGAAIVVAVPVAGAFGVLPGQSNWAPGVLAWQWLVLALGVMIIYVWLVLALMPRDYAKFFATPKAQAARMTDAEDDIDQTVRSRLSRQQELTKTYLARVTNERYAAGLEQGRREALQQHERAARATQDANLQARVSSAANAAYVQGRRDGAGEARTQVGQLVSEAYRRGVGDGERSLLGGMEGRLRAERQSAYQAGYRAGVLEGRNSGAQAAQAAAAGSAGRAARPRTRAEALQLLELSEGSSASDVDKRYRELRAAVHPDAIRSKKLPRVVVEFAEERFKLVGEAYDILRR